MQHSQTGKQDWADWSDPQLLDLLATQSTAALERVYLLDRPTPVDVVSLGDCDLQLKREDVARVHSYKWRGAFNKIKSLYESGCRENLVAASAGNHAQGVAVSAAKLGLQATLFMPLTTPLVKQESVLHFGGDNVQIRLFGDTFEEAAQAAAEFAQSTSAVFIPPYDDLDVIAGQSTIGAEIVQECIHPTHVFLPIGGGGMAAGVASVLRRHYPHIRLIGVEAENQHSMGLSVSHGSRKQVEWLDRFCDGTAVSLPGELTFRLCHLLLDDCITISNDEVCEAIQFLWQKLRIMVEPSAGLGVAAAQKWNLSTGERPLTVLSGSNVDFMMLPKIARRGQKHKPVRRYCAFEIEERAGALSDLLDQFASNMNIIDFQYGKVAKQEAYPVIGIEFPQSATEQFSEFLKSPQLPGHDDVTGSAAAEFRVIPFNVDLLKLPFFAVIEFANRPGALRDFMRLAGNLASVCYMNYTDSGQTEGQALMGFDFENIARQTEFLDWLETSQTKFAVVDIEVVRHFTASKESPRSWKQVSQQSKQMEK
jgi:threonine dehydratase